MFYYTELVKITLIGTVISSIPREMCPGFSIARWFVCVEHDGEEVETVLHIILHMIVFCE